MEIETRFLIEAEELSHSFGEKMVLDRVSFQVKKGEIVGLLGPSGAGKTTLVALLTGQLIPMAGKIIVAGKTLTKEGDKLQKRQGEMSEVGIMMDHFGLYERLSVWDNLKLFAKLYRVPEERIYFLLERAKLSSARKTPVGKLSKGMRSRVNFCRALLKETKVLFLDEPTSGLDPATTKKIHELILEQKDLGTTIFLTTHNMQEARQLSDSILLLHKGKIVERGKPEELCRKYNIENQITVVLKDGTQHILCNAKAALNENAAALAAWMRAGEIAGIHSSEPDLEQVFLHLTGEELNV